MKKIFTILYWTTLAANAQQNGGSSAFQKFYFANTSNIISNAVTGLGTTLPPSSWQKVSGEQPEWWTANAVDNLPKLPGSINYYFSSVNSFVNWPGRENVISRSEFSASWVTGLSLTNDVPDSLLIRFSSFTDIGKIIPKSGSEVGSFKFFDHVLTDDNGNSLPTTTTLFSGSFTTAKSAGPGNGGIVIQNGVYQTDWKGAGDVSYAVLKSPSDGAPVSFTLAANANLATSNEQGLFTIKTVDNSLSFGTLSSVTGTIGFLNPEGTTLQVKAGTIESSGDFLHDGVFKTARLQVSDVPSLIPYSNSLALFHSYSPNGTQIEISNESLSPSAYAAINLYQNNVQGRIVVYGPNNPNAFLPGSLTIETYSPKGIVFSSLSNSSDPFHFVINSQTVFSVNANSVMVPTALTLRPITDEEMFQMPAENGTLVNNVTRKTLAFFDGIDWNEVQLKRTHHKKNPRTGRIL